MFSTRYDSNKRFYGLKKLNFNSSVWDDSLLRERLGYGMFRDMNVHASRAGHALLTSMAIFSGSSHGGRWTDALLTINFRQRQRQPVQRMLANVDRFHLLQRLPEDQQDDTGCVRHGVIRDRRLIATDATLPGVIAKYNDVDYLMRYLAVDRGIAANDGIMAFWVMQAGLVITTIIGIRTKRRITFWLIPWDMYSTFNPLDPSGLGAGLGSATRRLYDSVRVLEYWDVLSCTGL